ncbi:hypothetical protein [Streptomyces palmae]|uniref:Integral membrane protein n=1 Tax=Streptomyces palmae TaxID=1701085 RepID=A0A4Z0H575_9ACTN|nr:hypothetical protein [Streptomyces palmae]TGB05672.1 hypothetical protein E4099_19100 [Streptomyces palmae]
MAHAARPRQGHGLLSFLDTDGKPHPLVDSLAAATLLLGVVSFITAQFHSLHLLSSWTGLVGIVTGAWGQMISATTVQRFVLIIGLGAAAFGFYLGMAHGGLFGGLLG